MRVSAERRYRGDRRHAAGRVRDSGRRRERVGRLQDAPRRLGQFQRAVEVLEAARAALRSTAGGDDASVLNHLARAYNEAGQPAVSLEVTGHIAVHPAAVASAHDTDSTLKAANWEELLATS